MTAARAPIVPLSRTSYECDVFARELSILASHDHTTQNGRYFLASTKVPILSCYVQRLGGHAVVLTGQVQTIGFRMAPALVVRLCDFVRPPTEMQSFYVDAARRFFDMVPADEDRCHAFLEERRPEVAAYDINAALALLRAEVRETKTLPTEGERGIAALFALFDILGRDGPENPHALVRQLRREFPDTARTHRHRVWAHEVGRLARVRLASGTDVMDVRETLRDGFRAAGIEHLIFGIGRVASRRVILGAAMLHRLAELLAAKGQTPPAETTPQHVKEPLT